MPIPRSQEERCQGSYLRPAVALLLALLSVAAVAQTSGKTSPATETYREIYIVDHIDIADLEWRQRLLLKAHLVDHFYAEKDNIIVGIFHLDSKSASHEREVPSKSEPRPQILNEILVGGDYCSQDSPRTERARGALDRIYRQLAWETFRCVGGMSAGVRLHILAGLNPIDTEPTDITKLLLRIDSELRDSSCRRAIQVTLGDPLNPNDNLVWRHLRAIISARDRLRAHRPGISFEPEIKSTSKHTLHAVVLPPRIASRRPAVFDAPEPFITDLYSTIKGKANAGDFIFITTEGSLNMSSTMVYTGDRGADIRSMMDIVTNSLPSMSLPIPSGWAQLARMTMKEELPEAAAIKIWWLTDSDRGAKPTDLLDEVNLLHCKGSTPLKESSLPVDCGAQ